MSLHTLFTNSKNLAKIDASGNFSNDQKRQILSIAFSIHKEGESDGSYLDAMFTSENIEEKPRRLKYEWYFDEITEPSESPTSIQGTRIYRRSFDDPPIEELKRMATNFVRIYEASQ